MKGFNAAQDPKASMSIMPVMTRPVTIALFFHNTNPDGTTSEYINIYMFYQGTSMPSANFYLSLVHLEVPALPATKT
jgi:hypothetical protein